MMMNGRWVGLSQTSAAPAARRSFCFIMGRKVGEIKRLTYCRDCGDDWTLVFTIQGDKPTAAETKRQDEQLRTWKCKGCLYLMF